jgi:hypothetical protein
MRLPSHDPSSGCEPRWPNPDQRRSVTVDRFVGRSRCGSRGLSGRGRWGGGRSAVLGLFGRTIRGDEVQTNSEDHGEATHGFTGGAAAERGRGLRTQAQAAAWSARSTPKDERRHPRLRYRSRSVMVDNDG